MFALRRPRTIKEKECCFISDTCTSNLSSSSHVTGARNSKSKALVGVSIPIFLALLSMARQALYALHHALLQEQSKKTLVYRQCLLGHSHRTKPFD
jgi:hypothetical protein